MPSARYSDLIIEQGDIMVSDGQKVAMRIQRLMKALNLNQQQLAEQLGITQPAISKYLQGRIPPADVLYNIAKMSQVTMEWILTGSEFKRKGQVAEPLSEYQSSSVLVEKLERLPAHVRKDFEQLLESLVKYF
jgi:transcriptional regulator with XRE-family HTH domain